MAISTSSNPNPVMTTEERKLKIADLREHHQPVFDAIDASNALFFPKMAYRPKDKNELHLSFFPSELKRGYDIYTEFVSREYEPEDQERTLWKWRFNPHWEEEYDHTKDLQPRYLIPVSELIKVNAPKKAAPTQANFFDGSFALDDDAPFSELTIRDLAAILLREPVSKKEWLNNLIK